MAAGLDVSTAIRLFLRSVVEKGGPLELPRANPVTLAAIKDCQGRQDSTQYGNFHDKVNLYRGWIDDAYAETDLDESIGNWRRVFGDSLAAGAATVVPVLPVQVRD